MPATNGGPGTYIQFGPGDHKGYKGDFLTVRELRGGELRFDGYYRPQWPSNTAAAEVAVGDGLSDDPAPTDARRCAGRAAPTTGCGAP